MKRHVVCDVKVIYCDKMAIGRLYAGGWWCRCSSCKIYSHYDIACNSFLGALYFVPASSLQASLVVQSSLMMRRLRYSKR